MSNRKAKKESMGKVKATIVGGILVIAIVMAGGFFLMKTDSPIGRALSNLFSNSKVVYQADTRFLYSQDGGKAWSETIQEVPVDKTYYLAVEMQVTQSEQTKDEKTIGARVKIPATEVLDCYLDDHPGVSITGNTDPSDQSTSYDFQLVPGISPSKFRVVFECKPLEEGRSTVEVIYDDNVSDSWDASGTIKYVK